MNINLNNNAGNLAFLYLRDTNCLFLYLFICDCNLNGGDLLVFEDDSTHFFNVTHTLFTGINDRYEYKNKEGVFSLENIKSFSFVSNIVSRNNFGIKFGTS